MTAPRFLPAFLAFGAAALFAGAAQAKDCVDDSQCPMGFSCEEVGGSTCPGIARPACPPGAECEPLPPPDCVSEPMFACVPGPCASDADCAAGMACITETVDSCSGEAPVACAPGAPCPMPPPPVCTTDTVSQCVPRYMLNCNAAADCGEGFDCVPEESCWCNGSSGSSGGGMAGEPTPDPGFAAPPPSDPIPPDDKIAPPPQDGGGALPPECGCTQGPNNVCQPREITCAATTECPTGWLCTMVPGAGTCTSGGAAYPNTDPAYPPPVCTTEPSRMLCVPPYLDLGFGGVGRDEAGKVDNGTGTGGPTGAPNPQSPTVGGNPGTNGATPGDASSGDDGSCQMGSGRAGSSGASLLALIGLAALARRRSRAV